nr:MAG TPA: hypothetical protein [Caudoviricetes sp.]
MDKLSKYPTEISKNFLNYPFYDIVLPIIFSIFIRNLEYNPGIV